MARALNIVEYCLQSEYCGIRCSTAIAPCVQGRNDALFDARSTLNFSLSETKAHELTDDNICIHKWHIIAFALKMQVPKHLR